MQRGVRAWELGAIHSLPMSVGSALRLAARGLRTPRGLTRGLCLSCVAWLTACAGPGGPDVADSQRTLRVGSSGDYAPFSIVAAEASIDGLRVVEGFDAVIAERFAQDAGLELHWIPFRWPELMADMRQGRFDVVMSGVTVRPERSVAGRFSVPVAETGAVLLVDAALAARHPGVARDDASRFDAPGLRVAVNAGGHLERVTRRAFVKASILAIPDNAAVPAALASGEADAVVSDTLEAPHWLESLPGAVAFGPFTRDWKAYWVAPGEEVLASQLDDWLLAREADGSLAALREQWLAENSLPTASPGRALIAACDERLALMPFVAGFKRAEQRQIVDAAREELVIEAGQRAVARAAARRGVEAPAPEQVRRFYRAQIDAAVEVQERVLAEPEDPALSRFDLQRALRPALIRIGDRMADLIVRVAADPARVADSEPMARALARHRLSDGSLQAIADAVRGLSYHRRP